MRRLISKNKKIRIFTRATAYSLIIIGLVLIFGRKSWWPSFYSPIYFGLIFLASAGLVIFSQFIFKPPDRRRQESIIYISLAIAIALGLNALGELYFYQLYKYGIQFDKLIHFFNSFLFAVVLISFYEKWHNLNLKRALKITVTIVIAGSLLWEFFEFSSDFLFKTAEFGVYGQYRLMDTAFDLLCDFFGLLAGLIFVFWRGWGNLFNKLAGYNRDMSAAKAMACENCSPNLAAK